MPEVRCRHIPTAEPYTSSLGVGELCLPMRGSAGLPDRLPPRRVASALETSSTTVPSFRGRPFMHLSTRCCTRILPFVMADCSAFFAVMSPPHSQMFSRYSHELLRKALPAENETVIWKSSNSLPMMGRPRLYPMYSPSKLLLPVGNPVGLYDPPPMHSTIALARKVSMAPLGTSKPMAPASLPS